ncbi:autotransporter domain-containing protein [Kaistia dalseonensis]|uniref:Outer membrane autotransporter protein n=1 Tax=Kaistia dalseonensis TaxID=410840 RepID=A0ABU0H0W1_9HYPH|nr:autotransporter domain-containing protein [Kaistia dalseonensis]MCX5493388.1 autotransporter domain-containing protein [Kaistia dalseonensis]MDQ0435946.1 outer membrane autotransporter protein [Kaistia dalseonensis]
MSATRQQASRSVSGRPALWRRLLATSALVPAAASCGLLLSALAASPAAAACNVTGTTTISTCDASSVGVTMIPGTGSLTVSDMTTGSVGYASPTTTGIYDQSVLLTGDLVLNRPDYSALIMQFGTNSSAETIPVTVNVDITIDSTVKATASAGFGTIWVRNDYAGTISIDNAGTIDWKGPTSYPGSAAIDASTHLGGITVVNAGIVTSNARGIYADGNFYGADAGERQTVSVTNTGSVTATTAGIRVIDYYGLAKIVNEGTVQATLQHGLTAWSADGDASITNSGTVTSGNDNAIFAATEMGAATVYNSGTVTAEGDPALDDAHAALKAAQGYNGLRANAYISGDVAITNTATGVVTANRDAGILAETPKGDITIINDGKVTAKIGIAADSGATTGYNGAVVGMVDGAVSITNNGSVTATELAVRMDGKTNGLVNTGTLATIDATAVRIGDGDTTVYNAGTISAGSAAGTAIAMGGGNNRLVIADTSVLVGKVTNESAGNALELTGTGSGTLDLGSVSDTGAYQGFSNLTKSGSGLWVLSGSGGSLTGPTTIDAGMLQLAYGASSASVFTVNGGTLGGTGSIGGLVVNAGGTVAPGYSPGTLTVNGNVAFASGSTYLVDIATSGANDLITATGTATISGGTVQVAAETGYADPLATYTILTASSGVSGTFDSATTDYAFLTPVLGYDAKDVYLTIARNDIRFAAMAQTPNERAAAVAAESLGLGNPVYNSVLQLTALQAPGAFNALSGEAYASAVSVIGQDSIYLRQAVGARVWQGLGADAAPAADGPATAKLGTGLTVWGQGYGAWGNIDGDGNAASVSRDIGGFFAGVDGAVADGVRLGVVGGYGRSSFQIDDRASSGDIDTYDLGAYGGARIGALGLLGAATYSWNDVSVSRTVAFPGYLGANNASFDVGTTQIFGEANWRFDLTAPGSEPAYGKAWLEPFVSPAYVNLGSGDIAETGSSSALTGSTDGEDLFYVTLGARVATTIKLANDASLTPRLSLGWQHAFGDVNPSASLAFASGGLPFAVSGVPIAQNTAVIGAGVDYGFNQTVSAGISYSGQFGDGLQDNAVKGTLNVKF